MQKFIIVFDQQTKNHLIKDGFQLLNETNGIATFLNDTSKKGTFDEKKVVYTSKMNI